MATNRPASINLVREISLEPLPQSGNGSSPAELHVHQEQFSKGRESLALKPTDRGRDTWTVLIAGFVFEALLWGFPMCFGVFQNYYSSLPEFEHETNNIALIGTLAQGLCYLGAPLSAVATKRFPKHQRLQIRIGWPMCIIGLLSGSFAKSVSSLIITQGILYGLGFVTLTYPINSMINEWSCDAVRRRGIATKYGYQTTLRASAVVMVILTGPLVPLFKARIPASDQATLARIDWSFLGKPLFWVFSISILMQGIGFLFPVVFLPSFATSLGISSVQGALLLAVMSVAQVVGQFLFGYLSDKKLSTSLLTTMCCCASAVATFVFWGLAKSMSFLIVFSIIYGFFAFDFGTMRLAMGRAVTDDPSAVFATYAIFVFLQGVGNVLIGPISTALMSREDTVLEYFGARKYSGVVLLTAISSFAAALLITSFSLYGKFRKLALEMR